MCATSQGTAPNQIMRLAINIDHVATLRQARGEVEPDPVTAAHISELAGAEGIVCHLREDRRHVNDRDLELLRKTVKTKLDLEMAAIDEIITIAVATKPDLVTFVPERREEKTTEGGLDVLVNRKNLQRAVSIMRENGIPVSLFVEPDKSQIEAAKSVGATLVELHTGEYANATTEERSEDLARTVAQAAALAKSLGLGVNAGHGLNYVNANRIAAIRQIDEVSIGHAVIARAVFAGLDQAVRDMLRIIKRL
jgi:pyridoxine 5-phosphate synthase